MTSTVVYKGDLRCECVHSQSSETAITDAPVDNNGKGASFSPTDHVATALASCMLTVMGIKAREMDIEMEDSVAAVTKVMASDPRRISEIKVTLNMNGNADQRARLILERVAQTCPVRNSLHPEIKLDINFNWS
ncbi:osmotically inducible protein OsmC [Nonlabens spongiae]|uniref:Osmotically inducible protein OsmC n=1 Tax=Nonlabens spongiae TaxID=331648 RepID=A0A1W6MJB1_9FLAO|nr:OsmC family protein [Nonlabens spongiae]ARN77672.1 osmotically inducible protein OsmC [Nonlabens spongiae]